MLKLRPIGNKPDERWKKITIRNLLGHRGGWDHSTKKKTDPTFASLTVAKELKVRSPVMPPAIIQSVFASRSTSIRARSSSTATSATCCWAGSSKS